MSHALVEKLWEVADREAERALASGPAEDAPEAIWVVEGGRHLRRVDARFILNPIGLGLERPLSRLGYLDTPLNSSTFAQTGGDGVHYGLLHVGGEVRDDSPVVMTVPMAGRNVIVGADLHEFLCLGCELGYFPLEQLVYDRDGMIRTLGHADEVWQHRYHDDAEFYNAHPERRDEMGRDLRREQALLQLLREEFALKPWERLEERLTELQDQYLSQLELAPRPEVAVPSEALPQGGIIGRIRRSLSKFRRRE